MTFDHCSKAIRVFSTIPVPSANNAKKKTGHVFPQKPYKRLLVAIKHTPYEMYKQMKMKGEAPLQLRWDRLKNRHTEHLGAVNRLLDLLRSKTSCDVECVGREELAPHHVEKADLVVAIGGDGTVLSVSHFLDESTPLVGINSDPTLPSEQHVEKKTDERRSHGALCYCTSNDLPELLKVIHREVQPRRRTRIQTIVASLLKETKLPPALNDVLLAHPNPGAVSRFRLGLTGNSFGLGEEEERLRLNVWSSGLWVSTPTGSSAAIRAAGGVVVPPHVKELQYMVREHLLERGYEHLAERGHGMVSPLEKMVVRWSSMEGAVYIDGAHMTHRLRLGDEVEMSAAAPDLRLFESGEAPAGWRGRASRTMEEWG